MVFAAFETDPRITTGSSSTTTVQLMQKLCTILLGGNILLKSHVTIMRTVLWPYFLTVVLEVRKVGQYLFLYKND